MRIITSALTLAEVVKAKGERPIPKDQEQLINDFFENKFIIIRNVDRRVGEYARQLLWEYKALSYKDAIHVATTILHQIKVLNTFDEGLLKLDQKIGDYGLRIITPDIEYNHKLFDDEKK